MIYWFVNKMNKLIFYYSIRYTFLHAILCSVVHLCEWPYSKGKQPSLGWGWELWEGGLWCCADENPWLRHMNVNRSFLPDYGSLKHVAYHLWYHGASNVTTNNTVAFSVMGILEFDLWNWKPIPRKRFRQEFNLPKTPNVGKLIIRSMHSNSEP